MKLYRYILIILVLLSTSCEKDKIGPLLNESNIIFFQEDNVEVNENSTDNIVIEVGAIHKEAISTQITIGGTAVEGVDYILISDLNLDFPMDIYTDTVIISLIDNENFDDDHTIILSLPSGQGYSENNRREHIVNIRNNELSSGTVAASITSSTDDAEEGINGSTPGAMDIDSSDLEFGETEGGSRGVEHIGLRFNGISIPNGATITSASIQFTVDEDVDNPAPVAMVISGEATDNATTYDATDLSISTRTLTTSNVTWNIPIWSTVGEAGPGQKTVDIKTIIQEIISRPGWVFDNSLNIVFSPTAATLANPVESGRVAESFDGDADAAPVLTIQWEL